MSRRIERLNEQLKREISRVIRSGVRDPRVGVVTVTGVDVTADLYLARVFVRTTGPAVGTDPLEGLRSAAPHIRHELGKDMRIRRVPELRFEADKTLEKATRIERILDEVRPEGGWGEEPDDDGEGS